MIFSFHSHSFGQSYLSIETTSQKNYESVAKHIGKISLQDSSLLIQKLNDKIDELRRIGYLASAVDTLLMRDSTWLARVHLGDRYSFGKLDISNVEEIIIEESGVRLQDLEGKLLSPRLISGYMKKLLGALEDNGYPFAKVRLQNTKFDESEVSAELNVNKGSLVIIDSLFISGRGKISRAYLENYLEIKPGDRYSKSKVLEIKSKIQQLPFVTLGKNPTVSFFNNEAVINLELKPRNASRFDFIIGLLQNDDTDETRFTFIFDVNAEMYNRLGAGEHLYFQFKRLQPEVQDLDISINYPYLLGLPFGVDADFSLYRNTNRNIDLDGNLGWQYFIGGNNYLKLSWDYFSSNLLDIDTSAILRNNKLPRRLDLAYNALGFDVNIEKLDYRYNPRKGLSFKVKSAVGQKEIKRNNIILNLKNETTDFSNAYDSLITTGVQLELKSNIDYYFPLGYRSTLKTGIASAILISEQQFFDNELFRIGGNRNLRGFDEESIFTSAYHIFTLEYRLILSQNSFLSTFLDYGYVKSNQEGEDDWINPMGLGAGLNFETGAGIFGVSTAVGKTEDEPFNFRSAKIHFGFISLF